MRETYFGELPSEAIFRLQRELAAERARVAELGRIIANRDARITAALDYIRCTPMAGTALEDESPETRAWILHLDNLLRGDA